MKKPELLCTAADLDELVRVIDAGADAVSIGHERFGLRVAGNFELDDIRQATELAHGRKAKVYISVNALFHNDDLAELPGYLRALEDIGVDAIVFGDTAVLVTARQLGLKTPLHWNAEVLTTNYETINYWGSKGATRAFVARELNMDAILEIKENADVEIQVQVHGMTCIFHSRRDLVSNYEKFKGQEAKSAGMDRRLFITEEKREDLHYPIYEDRNGTHIMSAEDICILEYLDELMEAEIDSFKIEGIMKDTDYNVKVVSIYRRAIDAYAESPDKFRDIVGGLMEELRAIQPADRELTTGFFFKEQVY
ncbi:peptidase U32 family protein [Aneurinibacillus thermoaerophilus]|uniref:Putative protease n=1 Tax=Aneurinibacillus thermoaerophilus TaxID=143495 RepID=A0A1G7YCM1_ANETH|nr:peptidase U32 family protein [Aneurinibacillus thermoaerophilus]MED0678988.1 U32 family peptidase [Aneurinibacillus thermoaerophilus]MED0736526.1 U32 family peptidase [Aneurinibacillus thermoaerophilus]MED0756029.1 U32 family peptidase [Aneurinibacillus thermoaerophilus]MED0759647.1 U32 family peptidase [Aneurinibacillus thermoaerophilus]MED0764702.1 U32 family peptidase [Aneurinibacillus thermoaerophilus]